MWALRRHQAADVEGAEDEGAFSLRTSFASWKTFLRPSIFIVLSETLSFHSFFFFHKSVSGSVFFLPTGVGETVT